MLVLPLPQKRFKISAPPWPVSKLLNFVLHPSDSFIVPETREPVYVA